MHDMARHRSNASRGSGFSSQDSRGYTGSIGPRLLHLASPPIRSRLHTRTPIGRRAGPCSRRCGGHDKARHEGRGARTSGKHRKAAGDYARRTLHAQPNEGTPHRRRYTYRHRATAAGIESVTTNATIEIAANTVKSKYTDRLAFVKSWVEATGENLLPVHTVSVTTSALIRPRSPAGALHTG